MSCPHRVSGVKCLRAVRHAASLGTGTSALAVSAFGSLQKLEGGLPEQPHSVHAGKGTFGLGMRVKLQALQDMLTLWICGCSEFMASLQTVRKQGFREKGAGGIGVPVRNVGCISRFSTWC